MRVRALFDFLWERHSYNKDLTEMTEAIRECKVHHGLLDAEVMWSQILPVMGDDLKIWEVSHPKAKYSDSLNMPLILNRVPYEDYKWACKQLVLDPKELVFHDSSGQGYR